ncbi:MAG TPA: hypothetical protein VMO47_18765 [Rhodothermales bacterium]|nr:hypothetical protein [Rhodothermales bacterium]
MRTVTAQKCDDIKGTQFGFGQSPRASARGRRQGRILLGFSPKRFYLAGDLAGLKPGSEG